MSSSKISGARASSVGTRGMADPQDRPDEQAGIELQQRVVRPLEGPPPPKYSAIDPATFSNSMSYIRHAARLLEDVWFTIKMFCRHQWRRLFRRCHHTISDINLHLLLICIFLGMAVLSCALAVYRFKIEKESAILLLFLAAAILCFILCIGFAYSLCFWGIARRDEGSDIDPVNDGSGADCDVENAVTDVAAPGDATSRDPQPADTISTLPISQNAEIRPQRHDKNPEHGLLTSTCTANAFERRRSMHTQLLRTRTLISDDAVASDSRQGHRYKKQKPRPDISRNVSVHSEDIQAQRPCSGPAQEQSANVQAMPQSEHGDSETARASDGSTSLEMTSGLDSRVELDVDSVPQVTPGTMSCHSKEKAASAKRSRARRGLGRRLGNRTLFTAVSAASMIQLTRTNGTYAARLPTVWQLSDRNQSTHEKRLARDPLYGYNISVELHDVDAFKRDHSDVLECIHSFFESSWNCSYLPKEL